MRDLSLMVFQVPSSSQILSASLYFNGKRVVGQLQTRGERNMRKGVQREPEGSRSDQYIEAAVSPEGHYTWYLWLALRLYLTPLDSLLLRILVHEASSFFALLYLFHCHHTPPLAMCTQTVESRVQRKWFSASFIVAACGALAFPFFVIYVLICH